MGKIDILLTILAILDSALPAEKEGQGTPVCIQRRNGEDKTKLGLNVGCGPPVARTWAGSGWTEEEADADTDADSNADIFKQKTAPSTLHFCLTSKKI